MKQLKLWVREREREEEKRREKKKTKCGGSGKGCYGQREAPGRQLPDPENFSPFFFLSTPIAPSTITNAQGCERTRSRIRLTAMDSI